MAAARKPTGKKGSGSGKAAGQSKAGQAKKADTAAGSHVDKPADAKQTDASKKESTAKAVQTIESGPREQEKASPEKKMAQTPEPLVSDHSKPQTEARKSSGFFPTLLGGAIAAALGFGAAYYILPRGISDETTAALTDQQAKLTGVADTVTKVETSLTQRLETLSKKVGAIEPEIDTLKASVETLQGDLGERLDAVSVEMKKTAEQVSALEARVLEIEKRPIADTKGAAAAAVAAYEGELQALRAQLEDQKKQFEDLSAEVTARINNAKEQAGEIQKTAEETAKAATARAAISRIEAALEAGGGFETALSEFSEATGITPPAALQNAAKNGVTSLANLQASFPEAARTALAVSIRTTAGDGTVDRLTAFLKSQVSPRSLEPREGDDPDAVLSRAEAELKAGDLEKALVTLKSLPDDGRVAMADWLEKAQARVDAQKALAELKQALNKK